LAPEAPKPKTRKYEGAAGDFFFYTKTGYNLVEKPKTRKPKKRKQAAILIFC
jgi:hypothetical protein